jgi:NADPH2:quinone reductase
MSTTHAVRVHEFGGPESLRFESVELPDPAPGEVQIRHTAIGLNFIDTYERSGLYPLSLPSVLGHEAAGIVERIGRRVRGFAVGDRVAYASSRQGAYAEHRNVAAAELVKLPQDITDDVAAAVLLKGLTAEALLRRVFPVKQRHTVLVHAAAGGVGSLLVQWARHIGARVIAIVGSDDKASLVRGWGVEHVLLSESAWWEEARRITGGVGVDVVYDSVGKDTFAHSLETLRARGTMVSYGNASGPPPAVEPLELGRRGSLFLTRPILFHYIANRAELTKAAAELFKLIATGVLDVRIGARYALADAAAAHADLVARKTTGSTLLLPGSRGL